jgi:hypothetical protein
MGPPERVTAAPLVLLPTHVTVATSDTVGIARGTVVVAPPTTVGLAVVDQPLFVEVIVYPDPCERFEKSTSPLTSDVPERETLPGPPVSVTVANETLRPAHVTTAFSKPGG